MRTAAIALISLFAFIAAGCSQSSNAIPVVSAQTSYTNATVEGTYSINLSGLTSTQQINLNNPTQIDSAAAELSTFIGSFKADGNGNIDSGTLTQFGANENSAIACTVTFTGTYTLPGNPTGTTTFTVASKGTNGTSDSNCKWSGPVQFIMQAGLYSQSLHLMEADGKGLISGIATRQ